MAAKHRKPFHWEKSLRPGYPAQDPPEICSTTGKRMYGTEEEAQATARHRLADKQGPARLRVYRCLFCDSWHLTSKEA